MDEYDDIDPFADDFEDAITEMLDAEEHARESRKRKSRDEDDETDGLGIHMAVSIQESDWARALKEAMLADESLQNLQISEMELVLCGMADNGNTNKSLQRIRNLHEFKRTYQILDTPEQGIECVERFMAAHPGFSLNISQCARKKHHVHVLDFAKWFPKKIRLESDWKIFSTGLYYIVNAMHPTISSFRNGALLIMEGDSMGWDNFCLDFERRMWYDNLHAQPFHVHEFSWVHPSSITNIFYSLVKSILPPKIRDVVQLGVKFDDSFDGRLDELFLQPSIEVATQRNLTTVRSFLELRYHNQTHFRIPDPSY